VDRAADKLVLVVEAGIDLVQPARLGAAGREARPAVELLARRPAVAAAGELAKAVEAHGAGIEPELEPMNLARGARLGECIGSDQSDQGSEHKPGAAHQHLQRSTNDAPRMAALAYSENTYSIEAVEVFLSSGESCITAAACLEPTSTAMYCLPLTE